MNILEPLEYQDIDEKIEANKDKFPNLEDFRNALEIELFSLERTLLLNMAQAQNLREQISYIDKKIKTMLQKVQMNNDVLLAERIAKCQQVIPPH
jgi:septal ring factor EnvC (AmiA/AmiB activator)